MMRGDELSAREQALLAALPSCPSCGFTNSRGGVSCACCTRSLADGAAWTGPLTSDSRPPLLAELPARFTPLRLLGAGADKQVYLARDDMLQRDVAVAAFDIAALGARKDDLLREARIMARVGGTRHVVTIYDVIDGRLAAFIISQFMSGGDLASVLARAGQTPFAVERAVRIGVQLCEALEAAHQRGVVHLDVKPANVLLDAKGDAFLADFGLARFDEHIAAGGGALVGTPAYLAPEQVLGEDVDGRCDLYALGSLLYELLVGAPPFSAATVAELLARKLREAPPPPATRRPGVPPELDALVMTLLARRAAHRPTSAAAARAALLQLAPAAPPAARGAGVAARVELPAWFAADAGTAFVGRHAAMARLHETWERACAGPQPLAIAVEGEPGIGKTRLAREFARLVHEDGATVLLGGTGEQPLAPYQSMVEALRQYVRGVTPRVVHQRLGAEAAELARLLPEVAEGVPQLAPPAEGDPESARYRMFGAVSALLDRAACDAPLLVVLEDLHWADRSTLLLLQHLLHAPAQVPLCLLLTYRGSEVGDAHPLAATFAELHRNQRLARLALAGLAEVDVRKLLVAMTGRDVPPPVAAAVHERTEGNPFFITETVRSLLDAGTVAADGAWPQDWRGAVTALPIGVRQVVRHRVARLDRSTLQVLQAAAVVGREFDLALLGPPTELAEAALLTALEQATERAVVAEVPDAVGRYRFTHALLREALYGEIGAARRAYLHQRVAVALESGVEDLEPRVADLAHHYAEGGAAADAEKAVGYALRAAAQARRRLAYQEASDHYERALRVLARAAGGDGTRRCEVLLAQADVLWEAGETATAERLAYDAAALARAAGAAPLLARAALAAGGKLSGLQIGMTDPRLIALLEESLDGLTTPADPLRARVMARLAEALTFAEPDPRRRHALATAAIALARRTADLVSLAEVLRHAHWALWGPENGDERLALSSEMVRLAEASEHPGLALSGRGWRLVDLMETGAVGEYARELDAYAGCAETLRQPVFLYVAHLRRVMLALLRGEFAAAEQMALDTPALGERAQVETAAQAFGAQLFHLRREQGRLAELEGIMHAMRAQFPHNAGWPIALAVLYVSSGRRDEAEREFAALAARDFATLPRDLTFNVSMALLTPVCAALGDVRAARVLFDLHAPSAPRCVVAAGTAPLGSASRTLAILATTMGEWDEAERRFDAALAANAALGSPPWVAHTQADYADLLTRRDRPGDRAAAAALRRAAAQTAATHGMRALAARLDGAT